jgi:hypothetical protein
VSTSKDTFWHQLTALRKSSDSAIHLGEQVEPSFASRTRISGWTKLETEQNPNLDRIFDAKLRQSVQDAVKASLGDPIVGVLKDRGLLEHASNGAEFHKQLQTLFGNSTTIIEKIIVKELFRKLELACTLNYPFGYEESLETARAVFFVEAGLKRDRKNRS